MQPTRAQVRLQYLQLLNDPSSLLYDVAGGTQFQAAFSPAYNALWTAFLTHQCPRIELIQYVIVPPLTYSLTPAQMGINDFGDFIYLSERTLGSNDKYVDLNMVDRLTQRLPTDRLIEANYRNDTFYFIGSTSVRDLQVKYDTSGEAPTDDSAVIGVDGCLDFLANYAAGTAAPWKGYDELGERYLQFAVGPRYADGYLGGELFRLIQPRVRSRQHVQMASKPYSTTRRIVNRRGTPYVAAQMGTTGGGATNVPVQFSTSNGTITGVIDGVNCVFWLTIGGIYAMQVYKNGDLLTPNVDYTSVNNQITLTLAATLQVNDPPDYLTAWAYLAPSGVVV